MTYILNLLLPLLVSFGYPIIAGVIALGEMGIPVPVSSILLAAGSLTIDGTFNIYSLLILAVSVSTAGDIAGYYFGKSLGVDKRSVFLVKAGAYLNKWGGWGVFLTRWLMTPLCVPINLVSGITGYPIRKFVISVVIGETLWSTIYIYLGYLFGINWQNLLDYLGNAPQIASLIGISFGILLMFKRKQFRKKN